MTKCPLRNSPCTLIIKYHQQCNNLQTNLSIQPSHKVLPVQPFPNTSVTSFCSVHIRTEEQCNNFKTNLSISLTHSQSLHAGFLQSFFSISFRLLQIRTAEQCQNFGVQTLKQTFPFKIMKSSLVARKCVRTQFLSSKTLNKF